MAEQMKPSGIDWIGDIPESWNTKRIKYIASLKGRIGWQGLTSDEYTDEGPYLITGIDFIDGRIDWENCVHITKERWEEAPEIHIKNGDLLITKDGTVGKVAIVNKLEGKASLNSGVLLIRTIDGFNKRFLFWVLQSEEFWTWFRLKNAGNSTIVHLYQGDFAEFSYTFPSHREQQLIADFLDDRCAQIDSIADDLEKQIEILQKYKKSFITETVTNGLDKTVPMKDSGIDWIGEIPENWDVKRLKFTLELCNDNMKVGPFGSALSGNDYTDHGKWVYNQRIVLDNNFQEGDAFISEEKYAEMRGFSVRSGDILITTRGTIGKTAIVPNNAPEGILHPCIIKFRVNSDYIEPQLLQMIFNETDFVKEQFVLLSNATTIEVIYSYSLKDIILPIIPKREQEEILNYIIGNCEKIDDIMQKKQKQLETIKQHKKSLIYEYVTGKKRVKEAL